MQQKGQDKPYGLPLQTLKLNLTKPKYLYFIQFAPKIVDKILSPKPQSIQLGYPYPEDKTKLFTNIYKKPNAKEWFCR